MGMTKLVFYIYYYENENIFTDDDGHVIFDLFSIITPQDIFLFKYDNSVNLFPMKGHDDILCEIIPVLDEEDVLSFDTGDDYERINRYEKAKLSCCYETVEMRF